MKTKSPEEMTRRELELEVVGLRALNSNLGARIGRIHSFANGLAQATKKYTNSPNEDFRALGRRLSKLAFGGE